MALYQRPSWDEYFMDIVDVVSKRATCDRGRSGCVVAKDKVIISTGYVGAPKNSPHCDDAGHLMKKVIDDDGSEHMHCMRTAHAEANAIAQAARIGVSTDGATLYCRMTPCRTCAMMIVNSGIVRVVAQKDYHAAADSKAIFKNAGVKLEILDAAVLSYDKQ
ncbi:MAG: cytidine/deoxycytidylate deaminase family protein [Rickettsiales bacterium]|jgi:dCMP deaminase|nr:cytidine/deoxycytidylate deaminase family protein [Rickettsiales bacterium]